MNVTVLGKTIMTYRQERGTGRLGLALAAGISYSYLANIETGTRTPSLENLAAIAGALGVAPSELLLAAGM